MPNLAKSALRLMRQLLGNPTQGHAEDTGTLLTLDGHSAVAMLEAGISNAAGLGASARVAGADLVWRIERQRRIGEDFGGHPANGTRGALATAIGQSLAGTRATAFINANDLAAVQDLLASARGRHLPLVLHVSNQALAGHSSALGSGHEALHISADSGCFLLFAANVQEAVDFTLIARQVAEQTLIPGLVIMDGEQTALALQDVRLPDDGLLRSYLGHHDDSLASPTPAQKILFGEQRRRVPAWYDNDRPVRLGGIQAPAVWGLGRVADQVFNGDNLTQTLQDACTGLAKLTGRMHHGVSAFRAEDATMLLVAQGAAIETAEAVAEHLRSTSKLRLGVLGLRALRPFPGARIAELLQGKAQAIVLERVDTPCAGAPPLLRELQATLQRSVQQNGSAAADGVGYPAMTQTECPRLRSAIYGLGGLPLRAADLIALCTQDEAGRDRPVYLGVKFADIHSQYPKRQVLLDRLRREYPDIGKLGLQGEFPDIDLRPPDALSLAVHRVSGLGGEGLAQEIACFLQRATGGQVRSLPDLLPQPWGGAGVDRFTCAAEGLRDPGAQMPIDLALLTAGALRLGGDPLTDLRDGAVLLVEDTGAGTQWPAPLANALQGSEVVLYRIAAFDTLPKLTTVSENANADYLLGAVFGAMLDAGLLELSSRRVSGLREQALQRLPAAERKARLDGFKLGLERVHRLDAGSIEAARPSATGSPQQAPLVVQRLGQAGDRYDSLPRFWDQVGVLYRDGETAELAPDPYLGSGVTPSLSSAFRDLSPLRDTLPELDPLLCSGCGDCWSRCPDGAVGALALSPASVLDTSIGHTGADALRPLAGKLAAQIADRCATAGNETGMFAELLQGAWTWLQERMPLPAERGRRIDAAVGDLREATDALPVVAAEPFFARDTGAARGDAALLFLAINPDACKGCGICVAACEPGALSSAAQTRRSLRDARQRWQQWQRLPDTDRATLERIGGHADPGPLATLLLTRGNSASLVGGDAAEPGSGERLAVRLAMAVAESRQRPALERFVGEVDALREKISLSIRETLADALPADDLDALERGLDTVESRQAELGTLIASVEQSLGGGIDIPRLRRLVQLARDLGDLSWRLREGPLGIGRARLGLVFSADASGEWSGTFPDNPFATPVVVDSGGDALAMSVGLLQGQLRQSTEAFRLVRRARHELEQTEATRASDTASPKALRWDQLSMQEREVCPPLLVVGGDGLLRGDGLSQIDALLKSDLPIRLIVLNQAGLDLPAHDAPDAALGGPNELDLALLALTRRHSYVAQTSIGTPDHLTHSLRGALDAAGPALVHLHAPSPSRHGFAPNQTVTRAQQAVLARVFPLFRYDPQGAGVFGSRFNLEGNPEPLSHWTDADDEFTPTPASWALGESRFAGCFTPLSKHDADPLPVDEYLALDDAVRTMKTPVVSAHGEDGSTVRFKVAPSMLQVCEQRQTSWQVLQEITGLVTPFTERVEQAARDQVATDHEAELAALRAEYESRIAALEQAMLERTRQAMRRRMMRLAGYSSGSSEGGNSN